MLSEALVPLENSGKQVRQPAVLNMNGVAWHWPFCCRHSGRVGCRAVAQSMATGSAAGSRVVVSVPHRCRPMPGRGYAESIAAKAAPTRASHALCEPRPPRCPGFCGKRACSRGLARQQGCAMLLWEASLLATLCAFAATAPAVCPGFARAAPAAMLCLPAIAPAAAHRAQARPGVSCCRCRDAGWIRIGTQRRWRIHAYSGSPASTSTTPQSSASLPTPITA